MSQVHHDSAHQFPPVIPSVHPGKTPFGSLVRTKDDIDLPVEGIYAHGSYLGDNKWMLKIEGDPTAYDMNDFVVVKTPDQMKESDPHGIGQHEPGAKNDAGKPLASLLKNFSRALEGVVAVSTYGAAKYTRDGWEVVPNGEQRYEDAGWRHLLKSGQEHLDPESGLPHIWHATWNFLAAEELRQRKAEEAKLDIKAPN